MKKIISTISIFLFVATLNAQIDFGNVRKGESVEYCLHHKKMNELKLNPAFMQQFIQDQLILQQAELDLASDPSPTRAILKIPIVFHILHNGGNENITNAQVIDAVEVLNRDYRLLNADANNVTSDFNASNPNAVATPTDIEVEFVLATKAPNGVCFNGITRTQSPLTIDLGKDANGNNLDNVSGSDQVNAIINGNDVYNGQWPGNKYLNVFVCGSIGGAAGYTTKPSTWSGTAMTNGIWILHDYVGRIGTGQVGRDRAMTHEIGHWLNLDHTWGPNNNPGNASSCSSDDAVQDTPNTIGVTACLLNENTCGPKANVENYMDYSYCSKMFTGGQKNRMLAALNSTVGGRNNVWTSQNLVETGADGNTYLCAADFYANRLEICAGDSIQFYDNSYNNVSSWNWIFQGAVNTTSTSQNPVVTYNTPGLYQVVLNSSDGNISLTKTKPQYIRVKGSGLAMPFLETFENQTNLASSNYWSISNPQNNAAFEVTSTAGHTGSKSVKLTNFGQTGDNTDELIGDPVDLSSVTSSAEVTLSFRFSYRKKATANTEKLYVYLSGNCASTWEIRKSIQGSALSSIVVANAWTPTPNDWTTVHMTNVGSQYWNENFRYKFKFEGNGGNNLYIDNINIYPSSPSDILVDGAASIIDLENEKSISIYPNPADKELNISYSVNENSKTIINIVDVLGKTILTRNINSISGDNLVVIGTDELAPGVYSANIIINGNRITKQVVIK